VRILASQLSRQSKSLSHRRLAGSFSLNAASSRFSAANFYPAIAEFSPATTEFCSLKISTFIVSSDGNYSPALTLANDDRLSTRLR
jgi:hypothetical protein